MLWSACEKSVYFYSLLSFVIFTHAETCSAVNLSGYERSLQDGTNLTCQEHEVDNEFKNKIVSILEEVNKTS